MLHSLDKKAIDLLEQNHAFVHRKAMDLAEPRSNSFSKLLLALAEVTPEVREADQLAQEFARRLRRGFDQLFPLFSRRGGSEIAARPGLHQEPFEFAQQLPVDCFRKFMLCPFPELSMMLE
jgi:hypothetical protein